MSNEIKIIYNGDINEQAKANRLKTIFTKFNKNTFSDIIDNINNLKINFNNTVYDITDELKIQLYYKYIEKIKNDHNRTDIEAFLLKSTNHLLTDLEQFYEILSKKIIINNITYNNTMCNFISNTNGHLNTLSIINTTNFKYLKVDTNINMSDSTLADLNSLFNTHLTSFNDIEIQKNINDFYNVYIQTNNNNILEIQYYHEDSSDISNINALYLGPVKDKINISVLLIFNKNQHIFCNKKQIIPQNIISIKKIISTEVDTIIREYSTFIENLIKSYRDVDNIKKKIDPTVYMNDVKFIEKIKIYNNSNIIQTNISNSIPNKKDRLEGLQNFNSTCYFITLIQILRQIDEFLYYINEIDDTYDDFLKNLKLIVTGSPSDNEYVHNSIVTTLGANWGKHEDIDEYLNKLFEHIEKISNNNNFIKKIINLNNIYEFSLHFCNEKISSIHPNPNPIYKITLEFNDPDLNIQQLIDNNQKIETIEIENRMSNCNSEISFKKLMYIVSDNTKYIFILLKRFKRNADGEIIKKDDNVIINEDIKLYDNNGILISFKPICTGMHSGSLSGGHYVFATLKYDTSKKKIVFDTIINNENVIDNKSHNDTTYGGFNIDTSPYLILYQRADTIK